MVYQSWWPGLAVVVKSKSNKIKIKSKSNQKSNQNHIKIKSNQNQIKKLFIEYSIFFKTFIANKISSQFVLVAKTHHGLIYICR